VIFVVNRILNPLVLAAKSNEWYRICGDIAMFLCSAVAAVMVYDKYQFLIKVIAILQSHTLVCFEH
jgi:hypothetical protein